VPEIFESKFVTFITLSLCEVIRGPEPSEKVGIRLAHFLVQWAVHDRYLQFAGRSWLTVPYTSLQSGALVC
jgi:hypothetical protein